MNSGPTLRFRLALRAFIFSLLALTVAWAIAAGFADQALKSRAEMATRGYLGTLVAELELADAPGDSNVAVSVAAAGENRVAQVIDVETNEIALSSGGLSAPIVDDVASLAASGQVLEIDSVTTEGFRSVVGARIVEFGEKRYAALVSTEESPYFTTRAWIVSALLGVLLLAAGVGIGVWLSVRSALRPVQQLALEAREIASDRQSEVGRLETEDDTVEIRQLIERLNSLLDRVRQSQERERTFLEDASHDLRTPLTVARAELDLASTRSRDPETIAALGSALEELDRLDRLTADLLILARARSMPASERERVRIARLVKATAGRIMRDRDAATVEVSVSGTATVEGDPLTLERAVGNLLSNAIRFARSRVEVHIEQATTNAIIRIHDDGPGFSDRILSEGTSRFVRDRENGDGTGLGIPIAVAVAESHQGTLTIANASDGGAVVTIDLPVDQQRIG